MARERNALTRPQLLTLATPSGVMISLTHAEPCQKHVLVLIEEENHFNSESCAIPHTTCRMMLGCRELAFGEGKECAKQAIVAELSSFLRCYGISHSAKPHQKCILVLVKGENHFNCEACAIPCSTYALHCHINSFLEKHRISLSTTCGFTVYYLCCIKVNAEQQDCA